MPGSPITGYTIAADTHGDGSGDGDGVADQPVTVDATATTYRFHTWSVDVATYSVVATNVVGTSAPATIEIAPEIHALLPPPAAHIPHLHVKAAPHGVRHRATVKMRVPKVAGGRVTLLITREDGGYRQRVHRRYEGGVLRFHTRTLTRPGRYVMNATFADRPRHRWADGAAKTSFRIR